MLLTLHVPIFLCSQFGFMISETPFLSDFPPSPSRVIPACRCIKEWYAWHFPELTKIVTDNIAYAKVSKVIRVRMPIVTVLERKGASADI